MNSSSVTCRKFICQRLTFFISLTTIVFYIILIPVKSSAQSLVVNKIYLIHGAAKDSLLNPLPSVTVSFIRLKDSVVIEQLTSNNGAYSFAEKDTGAYIITASHEGYSVYKSKPFVVAGANKNITVPDIILLEEIKTLKDVTVQSTTKKLFEASADKLVLNVEQSPSASGSSAFELLQRTPGITTDQNDNLLLRGSSAVNVMIDGKMTYLSAQQLSNTLKSMPAENISKIEIITNPSAQYDAAGNTGIINIITKKTNKLGYAANISGGIGFGHFILTTENITGNIRTKWFNFFGSFGYDLRHNYKTNHNIQLNNNDSVFTRYIKDNIDIIKSYDYSYKAGADFYLNKKQQIGFVASGSFEDWSRNVTGPTTLKNSNEEITTLVQNETIAIEPYYNNSYNLNYQFTPDTTGKLITADANYISYRNKSDGYISNQEFDKYGDSSQPFQKLLYHQPSNINIRSIKTDAAYPFLKANLKAGLKYSSVTIDNNFRYDSLINSDYKFASALSDHFIYTEQIAAAYLSVKKEWKNISVDAGLRAEHTFSNGNSINTGIDTKRRYINLFPTLTVDEQLNKNNKISIALSRRINRPSYFSLNPVRYFFDKYYYYQGNPYLLLEQSWQASLSYTLKDKYIATLRYNRTNHFMGQSVRIDSSGVLIQNIINYSHSDLADLMLIVPVAISSFWNMNAIADLSYMTYPISQLTDVNKAHKLTIDASVNQTFSFAKAGTLELMTHYTSPELNGEYLIRHNFSVDGGYKKIFAKGKIDFKCAFTDMFHTARYWGNSIVNTVQYNFLTIRDSRRLRLTLTYHLGGSLSGGKSHSTEEENRL